MNRISRFISELRPGDAVIAGALTGITLIACFVGLAALVRSYQVTIPAHGGTLTEGVVGSPRYVNPLLAFSDSDRDLAALTYSGLMGHGTGGKLIPVLAESYTVSSDGTIYTFVLRQNAQFSDGTPVTADDVVYTIQKAQDISLKSPVYSSWSNIRAEAIDAKTVRFTLPKAYAPFLEDTTLGILPQHIWQSVSDEEFPFAPQNTLPVGAGPFIAKNVSRDSQGTITGYTLDSYSKFVLGEPYLSHIHILVYANQNELQTAYKNGTIKSTYGIATASAVKAPYARVFGVFFNDANNPALSDLNVRKALSLAVDRTKLTQTIFGGYAVPLNGVLPAGSGVPVAPLPSDDTRLEEARSSLTAAGYKYDATANTWSKGGEVLSITLTTSSIPELKVVAMEVQKDWQALGVPVQLELEDSSSLTQTIIRPRAYGALLFGEVIGASPDLFPFWSGSERTNPGLNIANYENKDVDVLLTQARSESDPTKRISLLEQIQEKIAADYPAAFLYTPDFLYNVPSSIYGVTLSQVSNPSDRFWGVQNWYTYTEHVWPIFVPAARTGG
ncbi:MAG: family 5 extracellular solute-binding protein peptide/nickel transport system substrate-binding [Parcubacteria group bacterium]|nr:family 5 extracellular solute-binding protein peptide/nickel transport system substrate-binding [Parcubacteria group bacterium]